MVDNDPEDKIEVEAEVVDTGDEPEQGENTSAAAEATFLEDVEAMRNELNDLRVKSNEYLEGWQRSRADFANYKRRIEREQSQVYQTAAGSIIKRYLDVVDDLDRALKNPPKEEDGVSWAAGIELIYRKLLAILEQEGVKPIEAVGDIFDPNRHEAIVQEESPEHESGEVIEVVKQGYMLGDRVLRPAVVRIAK